MMMTSSAAPGSIMYKKVSCADMKVSCTGRVVVKLREYVPTVLLLLTDDVTS